METDAIEERYSGLAEKSCCLSCGGAINYSEAQEGEVCLDIGSGRGTDVMRLAEQVGENGKVYGLDITEDMIRKAEKTAEKMGIKNTEFLKSKLEHIPLEDNSVDLIISNCTLNHAEDKLAVWSEIYRTLKMGGRFVVSDIYSSVEVPAEYATDPEAVAECWAGSLTKNEYMKVLNKAGFKSIDIKEESDFYPKGKIEVASFTIRGLKQTGCSCS